MMTCLEIEQQQVSLRHATVVSAAGNRVQVAVNDEEVWALSALASPYLCASGDKVLVIGTGSAWYVIGVLQGSGKTTFQVPGDLELRAPRGSIDLVSGKAVNVRSPDISLVAKRLDVIARKAFERFATVTRWVRGGFRVQAGSMRTRIDSTHDLKANRILERAEGDVKIDGQKIHLG